MRRTALVPLAAMAALAAVALTLIVGIVIRSPYTHQHIMSFLDPTYDRTPLAFAGELPEMAPLPTVLDREVSFSREVLPILKDNCASCHSPLKNSAPPGGADLTSYKTIMKADEDDDHDEKGEVAAAKDDDHDGKDKMAVAKDDDRDQKDEKDAAKSDDHRAKEEMAAARDDDHVENQKDKMDEKAGMAMTREDDHEEEEEGEGHGHGKLVVPGKPEESELVEVLRSPRMAMPPITTAPLSEEEKRIITTWIAQGAKDN